MRDHTVLHRLRCLLLTESHSGHGRPTTIRPKSVRIGDCGSGGELKTPSWAEERPEGANRSQQLLKWKEGGIDPTYSI